jgi:peptide/nickel transport system substrate-binding protein
MPESVLTAPLRTGLSRRRLLVGAGGLGLAALLAACGGDSDSDDGTATGPAKKGGTLRAGSTAPPTAVDPVTMYDGTAIALVQLVADYLIWLDEHNQLVPRLAEKWAATDGNTKWTFTLRKGVVFSDGTPLDATAVKATFDRLLDPTKNSAALSAFGTVLGQGGVTVQDPSTVAFTLKRAFSDFPYLVSAGNYNAVILKADYAGDFTKNAIGTGPFLLKSYSPSTGPA